MRVRLSPRNCWAGSSGVSIGRAFTDAKLQRYFADDKKPSIDSTRPGGRLDATLSSDAAPKSSVGADATEKEPPTTPTPEGEGPKKKGILRRLRNLVLTLAALGALSFAGGVWYARVNDKFHAIFTEYVPLAEQAVAWREELDFRKRFPDSATYVPRADGDQVTMPASSGASWRVADGGEKTGRRSSSVVKSKEHVAQMSGLKDGEGKPQEVHSPVKDPAKVVEETDAPAKVTPPQAFSAKPAPEEGKAEAGPAQPEFKAPEVNEPSRFPPLAPIDPINVADAKDPIVQDLVRTVNDLITVINADKAHDRYGSTMAKAKDDVAKVGRKIQAMRDDIEKRSAAEVKAKVDEFDSAAVALVERVEAAMASQEKTWRTEFEEEMNRVRQGYDEKIKELLDRERMLADERTTTKLLEQALVLKKEFMGEVKAQVEQEREARLGKLEDLSAAVKDLEKLAAGWNDVVDANLKTQHLHIAVQAVRASLEDSSHSRPFVKELVALKQVGDGSPVVDAAIASINPSAYQKGVATPAQLIDRFRRVAGEVRKASLLPEDAGVASHATSWALSKVMFKKEGLAGGDDVESVLGRAQTYLEEGDLDNAAREVNSLEGWAKTLSKDWLAEVRKVLEVKQALDVSFPPASKLPVIHVPFERGEEEGANGVLGHRDGGEVTEPEGPRVRLDR